jgi:hypothetical protein
MIGGYSGTTIDTSIVCIPITSADATGTGTSLVTAVTGKKIKILGLMIITTAANVVTLHTGTIDVTSAVSGPMPLAANCGWVLPCVSNTAMHWMETVAGEALMLGASVATQVSGVLVYCTEA